MIRYSLCYYKCSVRWTRQVQRHRCKCKCKNDYTIEISTRHNWKLKYANSEGKSAKSVKRCMYYNCKKNVNYCNVDWQEVKTMTVKAVMIEVMFTMMIITKVITRNNIHVTILIVMISMITILRNLLVNNNILVNVANNKLFMQFVHKHNKLPLQQINTWTKIVNLLITKSCVVIAQITMPTLASMMYTVMR